MKSKMLKESFLDFANALIRLDIETDNSIYWFEDVREDKLTAYSLGMTLEELGWEQWWQEPDCRRP